MNKKMTTYERPTIDVLVVRFEERFLTGSVNALSNAMPSFTEDEEEDW